jgi:hypothetical protein
MAQFFASNDRRLLSKEGAEKLTSELAKLLETSKAAPGEQWFVLAAGSPDELKQIMPGFGQKDVAVCSGCSNLRIFDGSAADGNFSGVLCKSLCTDSFFEARRHQLAEAATAKAEAGTAAGSD